MNNRQTITPLKAPRPKHFNRSRNADRLNIAVGERFRADPREATPRLKNDKTE
jgi:hypothetical protein